MPDAANRGLHETETYRLPRHIPQGPISREEYLDTSYSPDREYRDGFVVERNLGDKKHSRLQARLAQYLGQRRKQWNIEVYTELRVQVRPEWFPLPDVCVYTLPDFDGPYPSHPPVLWIEILSPNDTVQDIWQKSRELIKSGVPMVWIVDPETLTGEIHTAAGIQQSGEVLAVPGTAIEITVADVMAE
jgi:Uma2 family endonuclease